MDRKKILALSVSLIVIFAVLYSGDLKFTFCGDSRVLCWQKFNLVFILSFFGIALFISSLAAFKASEQAFNSWKKITAYFFLAYVCILLLMPWSVGDEFAGFTKGMLGIVLSVGYTLFSCAYLLTKKK